MDEKLWLECSGDWDDVNRRYDAAVLDLSQWEPEKFEVVYTLKPETYSAEGFVALGDNKVVFQTRTSRYL